MKVKLEFSGGMDLLFGNKKMHEVELAETNGKQVGAGHAFRRAHCSLTQLPKNLCPPPSTNLNAVDSRTCHHVGTGKPVNGAARTFHERGFC
eukprot:scaffold47135_cov19-Tisochrysis_lutea.AAC.1